MLQRKNYKFKRIRKISAYFLITTLVFNAIQFSIPKEIILFENSEKKIECSLPFSANIPDDDVQVLSLSQKKITKNINPSITLNSGKAGHTKMTLFLLGIFPVKTVNAIVLPNTKVYPSGMAVGVSLKTKGILVLGTGYVTDKNNVPTEPAKNQLQSGDLIQKANGITLESKEDLMAIMKNSQGNPISLTIKRNETIKTIPVTPVLSSQDHCYKLGIWVRDSANGIGTVTYVNLQNNTFGALGHGVYDVDTKNLMEIQTGAIEKTVIQDIKKGQKGVPGELLGTTQHKSILGSIQVNREEGLYGTITEKDSKLKQEKPLAIGLKQEIHEGDATILSNIHGDRVESFHVNIESVNRLGSRVAKNMVIQIDDPKLLTETGGIIQGMSGSPILQDNKLIGAVTHVFVNDPTRGYGIFIENMLATDSQMFSSKN